MHTMMVLTGPKHRVALPSLGEHAYLVYTWPQALQVLQCFGMRFAGPLIAL